MLPINPYYPPRALRLERPRRRKPNSLSEDVRFWLLLGPPFLSLTLTFVLFDYPDVAQHVFVDGLHAVAMLMIWAATYIFYYRYRRQVGGRFIAWLLLTYLLTISICWFFSAVSVLVHNFSI